jgi:hypothetical protein
VLVDDDGGGGFLLASGLFNKEETDGLLSHILSVTTWSWSFSISQLAYYRDNLKGS